MVNRPKPLSIPDLGAARSPRPKYMSIVKGEKMGEGLAAQSHSATLPSLNILDSHLYESTLCDIPQTSIHTIKRVDVSKLSTSALVQFETTTNAVLL